METLLDATAGQWLEFWKDSPQRSVFSHPDFLACLPMTVRFVMVKDKGDVAGVPLLYGLNGEPLPPGRLPCIYHGIHLRIRAKDNHSRYIRQLNLSEQLVGAVLRSQPEVYLYNSWRLDDLRALQWHNYHTPEQGIFRFTFGYTGILDLNDYSDFEGYLAGIRACRRQEYQRFQRGDLRISDQVDRDALICVYREMFGQQGKAVSDSEIHCLEAVCDVIRSKGIGKILACYEEERLAAATIFLTDDRSAYYLYGMTAPEFRRQNPNTALILENIRSFYGSGIAEVDFVGVNSPRRGDFKASFNPTLKPYVIGHFKQPRPGLAGLEGQA